GNFGSFSHYNLRTECRQAPPAGGVAPTPLIAERAGQGLYIVPDEGNVSGGRPVFAGQTVRIEGPARLGPGLGCDPAHQPVVAQIFQKYRGDFIGLDPLDQGRDVAGTGLGLGGDADGCEEGDT